MKFIFLKSLKSNKDVAFSVLAIFMHDLFKKRLYLYNNGPVAEGLGKALQKLPQRFESARDLE